MVGKSLNDRFHQFIKEWKEQLNTVGNWRGFVESVFKMEPSDVAEIPAETFEKIRESIISLCVRLMSQRRHILYLAAAEGRFESIPAILSVIDNTHEKLDGYTPSQIAAKNNHMATVCELARYDISSIYDRSYIDGRSVLDGLFENLFNKMFTNSTNKDNIGIASLYTYGENAACTLGHSSGASIATPTSLQFDVKVVQNCKVSLGRCHSLILIDGCVYSCGMGRDGRLGHDSQADSLKPKKVFLGDRYCVDVSAGSNHSVVCTKREVIVFGNNENKQLGLNVSSTCRPTISYVLRNPNTELVYCYAGSTYSAVLTAEGQCIASGVLPWQSERQNEFQSSLNPVFANHTIQFFDKGIVAVQTYTRLTKIEVISIKCNYSKRLQGRYECVGIIESSPLMLLLKSSIATDYQRSQTIYSIFFKNSDGDHFIRLKFIIAKQSQTQHCPIQTNLSNVQLSSHGEFIAMDENLIVYEGYLDCDVIKTFSGTTRTSPQEDISDDDRLVIKVSQLSGLQPAIRTFISFDGQNKAILTYKVTAEQLIGLEKVTVPVISKKEEVRQRLIEVICVEDSEQRTEVFQTNAKQLITESDYCKTYFNRWSDIEESMDDGLEVIKFYDKIALVRIFVDYCDGVPRFDKIPHTMLIELLYFADRYGCSSFLMEILNVILRMPYDLMILRDLYEVSRSIANDEFNNKIDLLSAYLLPLMITCGFTEQLTPDELIRLEYQYTFNIKHEQNSHSKDVDCKRHELALKLFQEVSSKLFSNAETNELEYYEIGELLDEYLLKQQKKKQSFKTGNINSNIAQNSAKISHPKTLSVSEKNSNTNKSKSNNGNGQLTDLIKPTNEGSCDSQASSPIGNMKDKIKNCSPSQSAASSHLYPTDGNTTKSDHLSAVSSAKTAAISANPEPNVEPKYQQTGAKAVVGGLSLDLSGLNGESLGGQGLSAAGLGKVQTPNQMVSPSSVSPHSPWSPLTPSTTSTKRIVPSRSERSQPWGGIGSWVSPGSSSVAVQSLSEILAEEEKRQCLVKEMRNSLRRRNNEAVKGAKLKRQSEPKNIQSANEKKGGWVKESASAGSVEHVFNLEDIMAAEIASQNEAKRLTDSNLIDIDLEELAISELREAYEAEAMRNGSSITILVERFSATSISSPLWAARC